MRLPTVLGWLSTLVVIGAIAAGFFVVGSPVKARMQAADRSRVRELEQITWGVRSYFGNHSKLPATLAELPGSGPVFTSTDPAGRPYTYEIEDTRHFRLCAEFETDTTARRTRYYGGGEFDSHPKGRHCFTLSVKQ